MFKWLHDLLYEEEPHPKINSKPPIDDEPSMEDILKSIRKIINEDDDISLPTKQQEELKKITQPEPTMEDILQSIRNIINEDACVADLKSQPTINIEDYYHKLTVIEDLLRSLAAIMPIKIKNNNKIDDLKDKLKNPEHPGAVELTADQYKILYTLFNYTKK